MSERPRAFRGNQVMIGKVLDFADAAPTQQPAPSANAQRDKRVAAQLKREARNARRAKGLKQ
jgi:hypothetical protein